MNFIKRHPIWSIIIVIIIVYIFINYLRPIEKNKLIDRKSIQYVNDIYMSDAHGYNTLLDKDKKNIYLLLLKDVKKSAKTRTIKLSDHNCNNIDECIERIKDTWSILTIDHPELLSLGTFYYSQVGSNEIKIEYRNALNSKILSKIYEMRILRMIDDIKKKTNNMSEYEKVKYVYNWIGKKADYDHLFTYVDSSNQSAYPVFIKNKAVCAGFAKASQLIFQNIGIKSYIALGTTTSSHMWNIVKIDEEYYYFDSTVSSSIKKDSSYYYMGLGANKSSYNLLYSELYPEINGTKYLFK